MRIKKNTIFAAKLTEFVQKFDIQINNVRYFTTQTAFHPFSTQQTNIHKMDKKKLNLMTQGYEAPRAESIAFAQEYCVLNCSPIIGEAEGEEQTEGFGEEGGLW